MTRPLVLAGAGHAHLVTLRRWREAGFRPPASTLLINPTPAAWYSGMMPGLLAGRFRPEQCAIALAPLCNACGVELLQGDIQALDADQRLLSLSNGKQIGYQRLSLNTGSQPPLPVTDGSAILLPAKPFSALHKAWNGWQQGRHQRPAALAVLGGGAAAFELALALDASLPDTQVTLIAASALLVSHPASLSRRARRVLDQRGIRLIEHQYVTRIVDGQLLHDQLPIAHCQAVVAATGASAPAWLADSGLALDAKGFVRITPALLSISHTQVFAAGDCASLAGALRSGVYAVRQGPVLAENLAACPGQTPLREYHPQRQALALLATADGGALMSYGRWSASGRLVGWWKDRLDLRFMQRHRQP